jgi:hypothetical protein
MRFSREKIYSTYQHDASRIKCKDLFENTLTTLLAFRDGERDSPNVSSRDTARTEVPVSNFFVLPSNTSLRKISN